MISLAACSAELEQLVEQSAHGLVSVRQRRGQGSGVVLAHDGYIATNAHVVDQAHGEIVVYTASHGVRARLVGLDRQTDLAVLKIDTDPLQALSLSSEEPRLGQLVVALGDPFRFERSVSLGIISAVDRSLGSPGGQHFEGLLQTDAAINPGNSGGPLVDMKGRVVGINTAMLAFAQGMGFAIAASTVDWVVAVLIQRGRVQRPVLGIQARAERLPSSLLDSVPEARSHKLMLRVHGVQRDSLAAKSGIRAGDTLLTANGSPVSSINELQKALVLGAPTSAELEVLRKDGVRARLSVALTEQGRAA